MASNKNKDSNSSKTAHVMNLLSKNRSSGASEPAPQAVPEAAAPAAPVVEAAPAPAPAPAAPQAPLLSSLEADAAVASQIKDALETELEAEAAAQTPAPEPVQPPKAAPEEAAEVSADELMGVPQASAPAPEAASAAPAEEEDSQSIAYTNVMQILVEEKAEKYMRMFGICCCEQCQVDVKSYTLNHLPPKYVVLAPSERVPKLTVYESKYSSDITAQLIQACKVVMATPHHTRQE